MAECVDVCLRVCQDIQPGTELVFYNYPVAKRKTTERSDTQEAGKMQKLFFIINFTTL